MLRAVTCFTILELFVTVESIKPKSVNLALETVLAFDKKDHTADLKFIDDVQDFLSKVKTAVRSKKSGRLNNINGEEHIGPGKRNYKEYEVYGYDRRKYFNHGKYRSGRPNEGEYRSLRQNYGSVESTKFTDFIKECIEIFKTYNDRDLEDIFAVIHDEIKKYHYKGCKFHELLENGEIRRFVAEKLDQIKAKPARIIRRKLDDILGFIDNAKYDVRKAEIIDYINSLYGNDVEEDLNAVIDNLKQYGSNRYKRANINLIGLVKNALRSAVFDHYSILNTNTRKDFKIRLETLWKDFADRGDDDKKLSIQYSVRNANPNIGRNRDESSNESKNDISEESEKALGKNRVENSNESKNDISEESDKSLGKNRVENSNESKNDISEESKKSQEKNQVDSSNDNISDESEKSFGKNRVENQNGSKNDISDESKKSLEATPSDNDNDDDDHFDDQSSNKNILRNERKTTKILKASIKPILRQKSEEGEETSNENDKDKSLTSDFNDNKKKKKSTPVFISLEEVVGAKTMNSSTSYRTTMKKKSSFITLYPDEIKLNTKKIRFRMETSTTKSNLLTLWPEEKKVIKGRHKAKPDKYVIKKNLDLEFDVGQPEQFYTIPENYKTPEEESSPEMKLRQNSEIKESGEYTLEQKEDLLGKNGKNRQNYKTPGKDSKKKDINEPDSGYRPGSKVIESQETKMLDSNEYDNKIKGIQINNHHNQNYEGKAKEEHKMKGREHSTREQVNKFDDGYEKQKDGKKIREVNEMKESDEYKSKEKESKLKDKQSYIPMVSKKNKKTETLNTFNDRDDQDKSDSRMRDNEENEIKDSNENKINEKLDKTLKRSREEPLLYKSRKEVSKEHKKEKEPKNNQDRQVIHGTNVSLENYDFKESPERLDNKRNDVLYYTRNDSKSSEDTEVWKRDKHSSEEKYQIPIKAKKNRDFQVKANDKHYTDVTTDTNYNNVQLSFHISSPQKNKPKIKSGVKFRHDAAKKSVKQINEGLSIEGHYKRPKHSLRKFNDKYDEQDQRRLFDNPQTNETEKTEANQTTVGIIDITTPYPKLEFWEGTPKKEENTDTTTNMPIEIITENVQVKDQEATTQKTEITYNDTESNVQGNSTVLIITPINEQVTIDERSGKRAWYTTPKSDIPTTQDDPLRSTVESVTEKTAQNTTQANLTPFFKTWMNDSRLHFFDRRSKNESATRKTNPLRIKTHTVKPKNGHPDAVNHLSVITTKKSVEGNNGKSWIANENNNIWNDDYSDSKFAIDADIPIRGVIVEEKFTAATTKNNPYGHEVSQSKNKAALTKILDSNKGVEYSEESIDAKEEMNMKAGAVNDNIQEILQKYGITSTTVGLDLHEIFGPNSNPGQDKMDILYGNKRRNDVQAETQIPGQDLP